ncbi:MAG: c-type cytochrome biogenesis protein CcmI [Gammaproteobacteria bacterium]|nr:c-type cytochrome biogenesis protein CcmI [Gammaproteobacteria bacterium]
MTGGFLLACVILSAAAGLLFLWPRTRAGDTSSQANRLRVLTTLYQSRRNELDREISTGEADADTAEALRTELDASLLDETRIVAEGLVAAESGAETVAPSRWPALVLAVGMPLIAFLVYGAIGNPEAEQLRNAREVLELPDGDPRMDEWLTRLEARVERRPEEAESWYLLGHVLLRQQKHARAAEAFSKAKTIVGHDLAIETYWLQARYLAAEGNVDAESIQLAESILERDPANYAVLQLLSVEKARKGDFEGALKLLYRAQTVPLEPERQAALQNFIQQVRAHVPVTLPTIDVSVRASAPVPPEATLFVIARPVGGGMPYAVAQHSAQLVPIDVRLDDLASMNPANPLSKADQVEVVVRISLSGQPAAGPGDWSWTSPPVVVVSMKEAVRLEAELAPPGGNSSRFDNQEK